MNELQPKATPEVEQEYEVVYPNYKMEKKNREVPFYPSSTAGTLKYQRIPMCGHKFIPQQEPRHRNCEGCWFSFFQVHGELTQAVEEVYAKHGASLVKTLKGPKFLKNFLKFMSTVAAFKEAIEAKKEKNVVSSGSTEVGNETDSSNGAEDSN